jgi:hypothetical protein
LGNPLVELSASFEFGAFFLEGFPLLLPERQLSLEDRFTALQHADQLQSAAILRLELFIEVLHLHEVVLGKLQLNVQLFDFLPR